MIKNIIDAIAEALFKEFKEGFEIYTENVEQGLKEPCFFIEYLKPSMELHLGSRYKKNMTFIVQYIPKLNAESNYECLNVLERLFEILSDLVVEDRVLHEKNMQGEVTDGILTFTIDYETFVRKAFKPEENMDEVTVETEAKK